MNAVPSLLVLAAGNQKVPQGKESCSAMRQNIERAPHSFLPDSTAHVYPDGRKPNAFLTI